MTHQSKRDELDRIRDESADEYIKKQFGNVRPLNVELEFKAGFDKCRELLSMEVDDLKLKLERYVYECERLSAAAERFAKIEADDGDNFEGVHEDVILRVEITAGDLHAVRNALADLRAKYPATQDKGEV